MTTRIADIIQPDVWTPYMIQRTTQLSALWTSGIVQTVDRINGKMDQGNRLINMPYWNDLTGADEVLSDAQGWGLTPARITAGQDVATQLFRGRAWGVHDLAATLSGDDPAGAIANLVANYWARRMQDALLHVLEGISGPGACLEATHVNNISIEDGDNATAANLISGAAIVDTVSLLGDAHDKLTGIVMHSIPYFTLVKQDLIQFEKDSQGNLTIPTYMGKRVIIDDGCFTLPGGVSGMKYYTFLFGPGAIGYGEGNPEVPTETDRDSLAGEDVLINRRHFVLHPRGVRFLDANVAGSSPTNAELADPLNWAKVYEDKAIRIVALVTNG